MTTISPRTTITTARRLILAIAFVLAALTFPATHAATVASFDDITNWTGAGANRAALAIDWDGATVADTALVWGYRWDGVATGADLLSAVVAADPRLFARVSDASSQFGLAVYGLGYDASDDGAFAITPSVAFDADGFAISGPADGSTPLDPADRYVEGWSLGYWHYSRGSIAGQSVAWTSSGAGPSGRTLADGDWDGYAFARTLNYDEFPLNLITAEPTPPDGDFNGDGRVDAADYTVWRDTLDQPGGTIAADYQLWAAAYGSAVGPIAGTAVPEPAGVGPLSLFLLICTLRSWRD